MERTTNSRFLMIGLLLAIISSGTPCEAGEYRLQGEWEAKCSYVVYVRSFVKRSWNTRVAPLMAGLRSQVTGRNMVRLSTLGLGLYQLYNLSGQLFFDATSGDWLATVAGVGGAGFVDALVHCGVELVKEKRWIDDDSADTLYMLCGTVCSTVLLRSLGVSFPTGPLTKMQHCALSAAPVLTLAPPVKSILENVNKHCLVSFYRTKKNAKNHQIYSHCSGVVEEPH